MPPKPAHDKTDNTPPPQRVTRRDVAREAGVSVATVSHVINKTPGKRMSEETRQHVAAIAQKMGYRPSFVGKALVSGKTSTIGLLQPNPEALFYNLYQHIIHGMVVEMQQEDFHILTLFRDETCSFCRVAEAGRVDGLFILQSDMNERYLQAAMETGVPVVTVNWASINTNIPAVHADHAGCIEQAINFFAEKKCRTILEVNDPGNCHANTTFSRAFRDIMRTDKTAGMSATSLAPDVDHFPEQLRTLFTNKMRWDGVFIDGPGLADIFMNIAEEFGLTAGRDYQMVTSSCFDGETTPSRREQMALTQNADEVGRAAWQVMKQCIEAPHTNIVSTYIPYQRHDVTQ